MGYYTHYSLEVFCDEKKFKYCNHEKSPDANFCPVCGKPTSGILIEDAVKEWAKENINDGYDIGEIIDNVSDDWKWYEHQKDMKAISRAFPDVLFTLSGEGEEAEDIWKEYYLNGKVQVEKAVITTGKFDKSKLK